MVVTVAVRRSLGEQGDLADEIAAVACCKPLAALRHLDLAVDEDVELPSERVLLAEHGAGGHVEVVGHARDLGQVLLRQPLEEGRAAQRLDLAVLRQAAHAAEV